MKVTIQTTVIALMGIILFTACGSEAESSSNDSKISIDVEDDNGSSTSIKIENADNLKEAFNEIGNAFKEAGKEVGNLDLKIEDEDGEKIEVLSTKLLKNLIPDEMAGLPQTEREANKSGAFGFNVSTIEATYREDDERIEVAIVDIGGIGALASKWASWSNMEIDKERSDGSFERTTTLNGHKALEKYEANREKYELIVFVENRVVVTLKGKNVPLRKLKNAYEDIEDDLEDEL